MNEEEKYLKPEITIIQFQNDIVTISDATDPENIWDTFDGESF